jgi:hypothetical protein
MSYISKIILLIVCATLMFSCSEDEIIINENYFTINNIKYEVIDFTLFVHNKFNYLVLYDNKQSDDSFDYYLHLDEKLKYGVQGGSIIVIKYEIGNAKTIPEVDSLSLNLLSTFKAEDVYFGLNYDTISESYEITDTLKYLENNSHPYLGSYNIEFEGITTKNMTIECKYLGNWRRAYYD